MTKLLPTQSGIQPRRAEAGRKGVRAVWVWLCFVLGVFIPVGGQSISAARPDALLTSTVDEGVLRSTLEPRFRLGDAARPFGWSTIVGDFDRDGKPDVAVADHVARGASWYRYRLDVSNTRSASQEITFSSDSDAITISGADIDGDGDVDIVVSVPLSGHTLGVWLNDGRGQFTSADIRRFPPTVVAVQSFQNRDPFSDAAVFEVGNQRTDCGVPTRTAGEPFRPRDHIPLVCAGARLRSLPLSSGINPRAPPSRLL